jgi:hypothetical protein
MFGIIPDPFDGDNPAEQESEYIAKFNRFLEYLNKMRASDSIPLNIKFVTVADKKQKLQDSSEVESSTPGISRNSMHRFYVQLRKGKRETWEWMEVAIDSTFDTSWSYRIMFSWLVASSGKVDNQIQLLQRRCSQYGLNCVPLPQITVSRNIYLNPFKAPAVLTIRDKDKAVLMDKALTQNGFIHDGVFSTNVRFILECVDNRDEFQFGTSRWSVKVNGRQFVHRSGTLFARVLTDWNGLSILVVMGNYRYTVAANKQGGRLEEISQKVFSDLITSIDSLGSPPLDEEPEQAKPKDPESGQDDAEPIEESHERSSESLPARNNKPGQSNTVDQEAASSAEGMAGSPGGNVGSVLPEEEPEQAKTADMDSAEDTETTQSKSEHRNSKSE